MHAYIVVTHDRHCDDSYKVFVNKEAAIKFAQEQTTLYRIHYNVEDKEIDYTRYGDRIYSAILEDAFRITVQLINIEV